VVGMDEAHERAGAAVDPLTPTAGGSPSRVPPLSPQPTASQSGGRGNSSGGNNGTFGSGTRSPTSATSQSPYEDDGGGGECTTPLLSNGGSLPRRRSTHEYTDEPSSGCSGICGAGTLAERVDRALALRWAGHESHTMIIHWLGTPHLKRLPRDLQLMWPGIRYNPLYWLLLWLPLIIVMVLGHFVHGLLGQVRKPTPPPPPLPLPLCWAGPAPSESLYTGHLR
jgi:hypothetical protein